MTQRESRGCRREAGDAGGILWLMAGTELLGVLAGAFGVGMGASPLLQAVKAHRRQSSADVSVSFLFVLLLGGLAWLAYGIALGNAPLIVGNTVGVLASSTAIVVAIRWRRRRKRPKA